jgi:galactoside O-acetyltransferase
MQRTSDTSFFSPEELREIGLKSIGVQVLISRYARIYKPDVIAIGDHSRIDDFAVISGGAGVSIGSFNHIGCFSAIYGGSGVVLEDFVGISSRVAIYSESDDFWGESLVGPAIPLAYKPGYVRGLVKLERHVLLGTNCTILPNVTLGVGVAIGAHSLVTASCDAWHIYSGCPAEKRMRRSKALLEQEKRFLLSHHASP